MKKRGLIVSTVLHTGVLGVIATGDSWYIEWWKAGPTLFWYYFLRVLSLLSLALMLVCGFKNPGRLRKSGGREVVERLTQHVKNMSTCSLDAILEHTSQIPLDPIVGTKQQVESEAENPYARIEVELGSDSSRENRTAVGEHKEIVPSGDSGHSSSQQPTLPIKSDPAPLPAAQVDSKPFPESPQTRFCPVCSVDQILRSKHCNKCEVCVATYDHHCPWLGTCIGEKNRLVFLAFLSVLSGEVAIALIHSLESGLDTWGKCLMLALMVAANVLVGMLYIHHLFLIWKNLTTWEFLARAHITYLKSWPSRWQSPFDRGLLSTLKAFLVATSSRAPFIAWQLPEAEQAPALALP